MLVPKMTGGTGGIFIQKPGLTLRPSQAKMSPDVGATAS